MSDKPRNGTAERKKALLRAYLNTRESIDELLKERNLNPTRFQKWLKDPLFHQQYIDARRTRALSMETKPDTEPGSLDRHLNASTPPPPPAAPNLAAHDSRGAPIRPQSPHPPPTTPAQTLSEREWVYSINGEQGLAAYDAFIKLKEQRRQEQEQSQSSPQPDAAPSTTP